MNRLRRREYRMPSHHASQLSPLPFRTSSTHKMSFQKLKLSISKHNPSSHSSSKPAIPAGGGGGGPVKQQQAPTPTPKPPQAAGANNNTTTNPFGPDPATVYIAAYAPNPTQPPTHHHCTNAIYIQNSTGPDILPRISLLPGSRPVLDEPQYDISPSKTELRLPLVKVGTIPRGKLTTARNILGKQKPGDGWTGEDGYNSKEWVRLVLQWWADDAGFRWEEGAQIKVRALPVG
jgi:hypothetical protein